MCLWLRQLVSPRQKKAIQSLRPMGFASACGSEVWGFGPAVIGMAEAMPFRSVPQETIYTVRTDSKDFNCDCPAENL